MRFANLQLLKYGRFDGCELSFPNGERDFHLIAGPNEAGKSTAMDAVSDLLFGFPHSKSQDYHFDAALLRIAATLQDGGDEVTFQRRRGRANTLTDLAGQVMQENKLLGMLSGQTRDSFRLAWSLNHKQLREGGQSIVEAKDDVGQAIFAAGSGLVGIAGALRRLEEESEAIWKKRSTTTTWHIANRNFQTAMQSVRANAIRPKEWLDAKERVDVLRKRRDALNEQKSILKTEDGRIQRIRRLSGPIRRLRQLQTILDGRTVPPLTEAEENAFAAALVSLAAAQRTCDTANELLNGYQSQLEALHRDSAILPFEDEIERLSEQRGAVRKGLEDLPKRQSELTQRETDILELLGELSLPEQPIDELVRTLPSRNCIIRLRDRARELEKLAEAVHGSEEHLAELQSKKDALDNQSQNAQPAEGLAALQAAVLSARKLGLLDDNSQEAAKRHTAAQRRLAEVLPRLMPWAGEVAELRALVVPTDGVIESHRSRLDDPARRAEKEEREGATLQESVAQNRLSREQLLRSGQAVTVEELHATRLQRDEAWSALRGHLLGERLISEVREAATDFENRVASADGLADERYRSAEDSARLVDLDDTFESLRLRIEQQKMRQTEAVRNQEEQISAWHEELRGRGLPELAPLRLREWLAERSLVLTVATEVDAADERVTDSTQQRAAAIANLCNALPLGKRLQPVPSLFSVALDHSELVLIDLAAQQSRFERRSEDLQSVKNELVVATRKLTRERDKEKQYALSYEQDVGEAGLSGRPKTSVLDLYEELSVEAEAASELTHRVAAISDDRGRFEDRVAVLGRELGIPGGDAFRLLDNMKLRLAEAKGQEQRALILTQSAEKAQNDLRVGEAGRSAAEASFAPVEAVAGQTDRKQLESFVQSSRDIRANLSALNELQQEVLRNGDGRNMNELIAETEERDVDTMEKRVGDISIEIADLDAELSGVATDLGAAQEAFRTIDKGPIAVHAAADAELARAEMGTEAEAYILKRSEAVVLRWLIERQRQADQSPLLRRAGDLFQKLTLERYSGLTIDTEDGTPRLLGLSQSGTYTVPPESMSDGTKDQLYLSLRIAVIEQSLANGVVLPFLADDLYINYDDERARAGLEVLSELSRSTQVLFFTHHDHLVSIAQDVFGSTGLQTCNLQ